MCLPQLGLRLDGYQSGAILLFRGAESKHYVAPWEGDGEHGFRYAFDHTTHESVRRWCQGKKSDGLVPKARLPQGGEERPAQKGPDISQAPQRRKGQRQGKRTAKKTQKGGQGLESWDSRHC